MCNARIENNDDQLFESTTNDRFPSAEEISARISGTPSTDSDYCGSQESRRASNEFEKDLDLFAEERTRHETFEKDRPVLGFKMPVLLDRPIICPHVKRGQCLDLQVVTKILMYWYSNDTKEPLSFSPPPGIRNPPNQLNPQDFPPLR